MSPDWHPAERWQRAEDDAWWDSLSHKQRSQAFRQVIKLMHQAEVINKLPYADAMHAVFEVDYIDGLNYYLELRDLIHQDDAKMQSRKSIGMDGPIDSIDG